MGKPAPTESHHATQVWNKIRLEESSKVGYCTSVKAVGKKKKKRGQEKSYQPYITLAFLLYFD